ncbi:cysteine hydrolase family protein [Methylobacterium soli]|uniref:Cysteine hydrolase family protein n=1 Tax=Methylobacterium soli TaxID=553447 RepID=A0A6L3ST53_9HYPH|nr:cysteine hydrolase family protein [Methylobacterium soli]KAB1072920.1 cysteine hydrolase family protein [Methylobacterium soli]GJE46512.1 IS66 family transposase ISPpu30 [Methylobacterium soli]
MRQALLIVDVQRSFSPPTKLIRSIEELLPHITSVATVERHNESRVPFRRQLDWAPAPDDEALIAADRIFIKHGYSPTPEVIDYLRSLKTERVLVCGIQADTCVLAAGFALFDAGLSPTLVADLVVGSSVDRSGRLGIALWRHHFGGVVSSYRDLIPERG